MKKAYMKPEIMFESFAPSASIALNCALTSNNFATVHECGYRVPDYEYPIFVTGVEGCERQKDDDGFGNVCYDVPDENWKLFDS